MSRHLLPLPLILEHQVGLEPLAHQAIFHCFKLLLFVVEEGQGHDELGAFGWEELDYEFVLGLLAVAFVDLRLNYLQLNICNNLLFLAHIRAAISIVLNEARASN